MGGYFSHCIMKALLFCILAVICISANEQNTNRQSDSNKCLGGDECCEKDKLCGEGEGDCDHDSDCKSGLFCGHNNCPNLPSFDTSDDCCYDPQKVKCEGGNGCCGKNGKRCGEGEGDCDYDRDCEGNLECGSNNCAWDKHKCDKWYKPGFLCDDCCEKPKD